MVENGQVEQPGAMRNQESKVDILALPCAKLFYPVLQERAELTSIHKILAHLAIRELQALRKSSVRDSTDAAADAAKAPGFSSLLLLGHRKGHVDQARKPLGEIVERKPRGVP